MKLLTGVRHARYIFFALALLFSGVIVTILAARPAEEQAPPMTMAVVGNIESTILAGGTLHAREQVNVGAQASGQVKLLKVVLDQQVTKGDLIAEVDSATQKNELRNAAAGLNSLQAQLRARQKSLQLAEHALKRQRDMLAQDATSRADYENAEAAVSTARAEVDVLDAQIDQALIQAAKAVADLGHTQIRAPISGKVVAINTKAGQTLNSTQTVPTIVTLARLDTVTVKAQISEADVMRIKTGQEVYFSLMSDPNVIYRSRLRTLESLPGSAEGESTGGMATPAIYYSALFDVPNPDGKLRIGMTAQVSVVLAEAKSVVIVPVSALGPQGKDGRYAVRVFKDGDSEMREVKTGVRDNINVEITSGLAAGEMVLLHTPTGSPDSGAASSAGFAMNASIGRGE